MSSLLVEINNRGVLTFTLNRPDVHNAFDDLLLEKLTSELKKYNTDKRVKVLVIQSTGKSFCAGADLNWMKSMKDYSLEENIEDSKKLSNFFYELNRFPSPTIAKVQGAVFGGGLGILGCVDFVVASSKSKYCFSEVKLGLIPAVISPYVLPKLGAARLRELFLSAKVFTAAQAFDYGLVSEVVDDSDQLTSTCNSLITQILSLGPQALRKAKELIFTIADLSPENLTDYTCKMIAGQRISKEGQEGMKALLEKRTPQF
jgi:methylglutaconyl-CoA hydratase